MSVFIWTEIFNCGKIGKIALESFNKHHPQTIVHVYGVPKDFEIVKHVPNLEFHDIPTNIQASFRQGHLGTATLWASLIQTRPEQHMIHFDSDVIFRQECISDILIKLNEGYSLVGPIRNYINNPNGRDDVRHIFLDLIKQK